MDIALTRGVSPAIARCELTFVDRRPIDPERAREQHRSYCRSLEDLGFRILAVPAHPDLPDCCFVEDTAVVLDEIAVLTRPGAISRRREVAAIADALTAYRPLARIPAPARLDGGDVLVLGRRIFVGRSPRTDAAGVRALERTLQPLGYSVSPVAVRGCLHLKTAVTAIGEGALLANPEWVDLTPFADVEVVAVHPDEPFAANVLLARDAIVAAAGNPRTNEKLSNRGLRLITVDVSEFEKAEAGVTCKSLLFAASATP